MEKKQEIKRVEDLNVEGVADLLERWGMEEFVDFVKEKELDGRKIMDVSEGIVKLWRPRANAKRFIRFLEDLKANPDNYMNMIVNNDVTDNSKASNKADDHKIEVKGDIIAQYQTVNVRKKTEHFTTATVSGVEEMLRKIVPAKSFLYRNQPADKDKPISSYLPMDPGAQKKPRKFFRLSSYEYPHFDMKQFRFSKAENFNDRGYYSIKTNSRYYIQKTYRKPDSRTKYKSLPTAEEIDKAPEDHLYEDLNYSDMEKDADDLKEINHNAKPYKVKLQELFQSFKLPFFKKNEDSIEGEIKLEEVKPSEIENDAHIYENTDNVVHMYDSIHVSPADGPKTDTDKQQTKTQVEDYLEPVQVNREYSDVTLRRDDSILGYILSLFDTKFGMKRETTDDADQSELSEDSAPAQPMSARPLPVPVENEPYYMNIERAEAENLLRGQPDGTFVLRPSSQPNHAYTLTVSCANAVHNVPVRRRPDCRLALGFARRGERSFATVTSLVRHHRRRRLLLVAGGEVCGATTLNDSPQYYQTPSGVPLH